MSQNDRNLATMWRLILVLPAVAALLVLLYGHRQSADLYQWINDGGRQRWRAEKIASAVESGNQEAADRWAIVWRATSDRLHENDPHCGVCATLEILAQRIDTTKNITIPDKVRAETARGVAEEMDAIIDRVERVAMRSQSGIRIWLAVACQIVFSLAAIGHTRYCECRV